MRAIEERLASWTVDRRVGCVRVADATQSALAATHIFDTATTRYEIRPGDCSNAIARAVLCDALEERQDDGRG